jgi:hypothetical protein
MRRVEIFDTTLRDGEQSPCISLSRRDVPVSATRLTSRARCSPVALLRAFCSSGRRS